MITGLAFLDAVLDAYTLVQGYCDTLNRMNVFPVPDGDTGTNLLHTLSGAKTISVSSGETLSKVSAQVASALLEKARGNSGVMLSLLFRGLAEGFKNTLSADGKTLNKALRMAYEWAWNSVPDPKEGTILTVAKYAADGAELAMPQTVQSVITGACDGALRGLRATKNLLPVLREAGVVDAGGYGYWLVLRAMAERFGGQYTMTTFSAPTEQTTVTPNYRYCTEFWIRQVDERVNATAYQDGLSACGDCGTVIAEHDRMKVHIHTDHPGQVLEQALQYGTVYDIKIDDMIEQSLGRRG